jgi:hypothetical protein
MNSSPYKIFKQKLKKLIPMQYIEIYKNLQPAFFFKKKSYSQCGEDIIVEFILNEICRNEVVNYCDIGAHLPWKFSNTAKFYLKNKALYVGVLVEPDPFLARYLMLKRPKDIIINKGVKSAETESENLDLFIMETRTLNTFSQKEAAYYESLGHRIQAKQRIEVIDINTLLRENFTEKVLHFLSIDVEGMDFDILNSFDFDIARPLCICVETIKYSKTGIAEKNSTIVEFLKVKGYFEYAFTGINSIFVDKAKWEHR